MNQRVKAKPSDEWYTPPDIIDASVDVFDEAFFDPCLCENTPAADHAVNACSYYDARTSDWWHVEAASGNPVFLNPAYSDPLAFVQSLLGYIEEYAAEAILVVNASTAAQWYQLAFEKADAVCMPSPRIRFLRRPIEYPDNRLATLSVHASAAARASASEEDEKARSKTEAERAEAAENKWGLVQPNAPRYNNTIFYYSRLDLVFTGTYVDYFCKRFARFGVCAALGGVR